MKFRLSHLHLIFGIFVLIIFAITGRFMRSDFPDKEAIEQEFRLLMRSRHIYILFSSLIHIALGLYFSLSPALWRKALQLFGSALLFLATSLLIYAFFLETYTLHRFSDLSRYGIYASLAGIAFHLLSNIGAKAKLIEKALPDK